MELGCSTFVLVRDLEMGFEKIAHASGGKSLTLLFTMFLTFVWAMNCKLTMSVLFSVQAARHYLNNEEWGNLSDVPRYMASYFVGINNAKWFFLTVSAAGAGC
jgi:hypothetical protein